MNTDIQNTEIRIVGGLPYPVAKRQKGHSEIDACPYCGEQHAHTQITGFKNAECSDDIKEVKIQGYLIPAARGYIVEDYSLEQYFYFISAQKPTGLEDK